MKDYWKEQLVKAIEKELDTTDKRIMFLRLEFPKRLRYIRIEGSGNVFSTHLIGEFKKNGMVLDLVRVMNDKLGYEIIRGENEDY